MKCKLIIRGAVIGLLAAFSLTTLAGTPSKDFTDPLTGPDSPHIDISLSNTGQVSYEYTIDGLERVFADCQVYRPWGPCWKFDRPMNKTVSSDFVDDFVAEVHISRVGLSAFDLAWFGFGPGNAIGGDFEPSGFGFRVHADANGAAQIDVAFWDGTRNVIERLHEAGTWDNVGGETFRIEKSGDDVAMSMVGGNSHTFSISQVLGAAQINMDSTNSHLFFGNTHEGTVFSNFMVGSAAQDEDGDGVIDDLDQCFGTAESAVVDETGCSIAQICSCDGFINHGGFQSCTARAVEAFVVNGLLTEEEGEEVTSAAAKSACGKPAKGNGKGKGRK